MKRIMLLVALVGSVSLAQAGKMTDLTNAKYTTYQTKPCSRELFCISTGIDLTKPVIAFQCHGAGTGNSALCNVSTGEVAVTGINQKPGMGKCQKRWVCPEITNEEVAIMAIETE